MRLKNIAVVIAALATVVACQSGVPQDGTRNHEHLLPTPARSEVLIIDEATPSELTDPEAASAYRQGYSHMRDAAWFAAVASFGEAIRIQPEVAGLYEARGTACMYGGRHDEAIADYTTDIELEPDDAGHWRRRAHAYTIAPTPQPHMGVEDASRAIELDPHHPMGYGHRAVALTELPTPDWQQALADMHRYIELFEGHDPEAYRFRASIHENLGNHGAAEKDRQWAQQPHFQRFVIPERRQPSDRAAPGELSGEGQPTQRHRCPARAVGLKAYAGAAAESSSGQQSGQQKPKTQNPYSNQG